MNIVISLYERFQIRILSLRFGTRYRNIMERPREYTKLMMMIIYAVVGRYNLLDDTNQPQSLTLHPLCDDRKSD